MPLYAAPFRNEQTNEEVTFLVEADHEDHALELLPERLAAAGLPRAVEVDGTEYDPWGLLPLRPAEEGEEEDLWPRKRPPLHHQATADAGPEQITFNVPPPQAEGEPWDEAKWIAEHPPQ